MPLPVPEYDDDETGDPDAVAVPPDPFLSAPMFVVGGHHGRRFVTARTRGALLEEAWGRDRAAMDEALGTTWTTREDGMEVASAASVQDQFAAMLTWTEDFVCDPGKPEEVLSFMRLAFAAGLDREARALIEAHVDCLAADDPRRAWVAPAPEAR